MTERDRRFFPLVLNAVGVAVVAYAYFTSRFATNGWLTAATILALLTWATVELLRWRLPQGTPGEEALRWVRRVATVAGVAVASFTQVPTGAIHTAPLAVLIVLALSDETESVWFGSGVSLLSFVLTPIGALLAGGGTQSVLGFLAANAVWTLIGISRRQSRTAVRRNRELAAQQLAAQQQEARAGVLAARQGAARDIHDVLAHSLGGLVIQLDAAEALIESGRSNEAHAKVAQARTLAAEGLAESRRAVAALRSPDDSDASEQTSSDLAGAAERLLRAHRELGGDAEARIDLDAAPHPLAPRVAGAFERALQESLSNARRHAPGEPVTVDLVAAAGRLTLTVSNSTRTSRTHSDAGGGHGLTGMAERFAAVDGGAVTAQEHAGRFVVSASARLVRED